MADGEVKQTDIVITVIVEFLHDALQPFPDSVSAAVPSLPFCDEKIN